MNIEKYRVFIAIQETGSLTGAAERLGYTQSGVSHILASLESEFGLTLINRSRTRITLTPEGERLLRLMRDVVSRDEQLMQEVSALRGVTAGVLRVGTVVSVAVQWLPELVKLFTRKFPLIELELLDGVYSDMEDWLSADRIDCAFVTRATKKEYDYIPLKEDRLLAILPLDHPLAELDVLPLPAIRSEPFIIPGEGSGYDIGRILKSAGVRPNVRFEMSDDYAAIAMVEHGLGISILPELVLSGTNANVRVLELEGFPRRTIGLALKSKKTASPACREFINAARQWVHERYEPFMNDPDIKEA